MITGVDLNSLCIAVCNVCLHSAIYEGKNMFTKNKTLFARCNCGSLILITAIMQNNHTTNFGHRYVYHKYR